MFDNQSSYFQKQKIEKYFWVAVLTNMGVKPIYGS
jgi:hypothetical protein